MKKTCQTCKHSIKSDYGLRFCHRNRHFEVNEADDLESLKKIVPYLVGDKYGCDHHHSEAENKNGK